MLFAPLDWGYAALRDASANACEGMKFGSSEIEKRASLSQFQWHCGVGGYGTISRQLRPAIEKEVSVVSMHKVVKPHGQMLPINSPMQ
jgi:hypothetical protein